MYLRFFLYSYVMPHVYAIANTKGGVGKSTLAVNMAVVAATHRHQVLLVDADPQTSGLQFLNARNDTRPHVAGIQLTQPVLHTQLPALAAPYDYVFIDVGGRDAPVFRSALVAADTILVPIVPSAFDTWAAEDVFAVLDELAASGDVDARVVLNQATPTIIAKEALQRLQSYLDARKITLMATILQRRTAWPRAVGEGLGVGEWEPAGKAAQELSQLTHELGMHDDEGSAATA